ncbi:HlyD family secretion protein [Endozoicomonas numazuensis]|uniref:Membrane protein n=1 Tax=Endozoicomonas numazuensis TaxID=1137799 RepID=A0A081NFK6_9GAMM|nr:biotin/lipoyl-binding protein [Endozoicomonas numazuensis]KEQ17229.1 membrane protein [Endozoicomonas numazuensis]
MHSLQKLLFGTTVTLLLSGCFSSDARQALGTLERDRITLEATASELITDILIPEGSPVKMGQLILKLDDRKQLAAVAAASAEAARARAYLDEMINGARVEDIAAARANVRQIEARLVDANKTFQRNALLLQRKLISQSELDQARAARDALKAEKNNAREKLMSLLNGNRPESIAQAEASLNKALANHILEEQKLDDLSIYATRNSRLDSLPRHLGERVSAGSPLAILLVNEAPYARIYVPEPHKASLHVGDHVTIHIDGVGKTFLGQVRWISLDPAFTPHYALNEKERSRLVYMAEVQLPETAADLPSGLPVQVDLPL